MLDVALKAGLPIIAVATDDTVNLAGVLQSIAKKPAREFTVADFKKPQNFIYYTSNIEHITEELYKKFMEEGYQLILVNPPRVPTLAFDAGILPTPDKMADSYLMHHVTADEMPSVRQALKGLSLKAMVEVMRLTQAQTGGAKPTDLRRVRASLTTTIPGLYQVDTAFEFYAWPAPLLDWLTLNKKYFLQGVNWQLIPRGILLTGAPGTGKSMAAKAIAVDLGVPLYRLDIASTLDKFVGVSEGRVAKILQLVDREGPCVLLIDELEKIFEVDGEPGAPQRILSQLLWWLAEHKSRVLTVMTTNDEKKIPPELFRAGRVDLTLRVTPLSLSEAKVFAQREFKAVVGKDPTLGQMKIMSESFDHASEGITPPDFAHSKVAVMVRNTIKRQNWVL